MQLYPHGMNLGEANYSTAERPLLDTFRLHHVGADSAGEYDPVTHLPTGKDTKGVKYMVPLDPGPHNWTYIFDGPMSRILNTGGPTIKATGLQQAAFDLSRGKRVVACLLHGGQSPDGRGLGAPEGNG